MKTQRLHFLKNKLVLGLTLFLAVFTSCSGIAPVVLADTFSDSEYKAIQEYPHWVGGVTDCGSGAPDTATNVLTGPVYILGDSITRKAQADYQRAFASKGISGSIDASSSRSLSDPGIDGNKLSGMDAIAADTADIAAAGAIVIALGTNGGTTAASINKAIAEIRKANDTAPIFWVDTISVGRADTYNNDVIKPANKAIYGQAASQTYTVISWFKTVDSSGDPEAPTPKETDPKNLIVPIATDSLGVHPTAAGGKALADLVVGTVSGGTTGGAAAAGTPLTPGTGSPTGGIFPNLDPGAMATSINNFIVKANPTSKMKGLGSTIVASAQAANVNPFLIVAIARKESGMSAASDFNVSHGNNSFGRQATSSQPNFPGGGASSGVLWYRWTSVKASVDSTAPENKNAAGGGDAAAYLRDKFGSKLDSGDLVALMLEYAPPAANDTATYTAQVKGWISDMVDGAGGVSATPVAAATGPTASCCPTTGAAGADALAGSGRPQQAFNFFRSKGLSVFEAAVIVGTFEGESGPDLDPTITNGIGAHGIAQWTNPPYSTRRPALNTFAQSKNPPTDENDFLTQLQFAWKELSSNYAPSLAHLKAISPESLASIEQAVFDFESTYEVSGHGNMPARYAAAKALFNAGGSAVPGDPAAPPDPSASACGTAVTGDSTIAAYKNPLRDVMANANFKHLRIDEGVDYQGHGDVFAIGNGIVTFAGTGYWFAAYGQSTVYKLTDGPAAGKSVYFSESCTPAVSKGDHVTADTVICHMHGDNSPWTETGWALGTPGKQDEPAASFDYHECATEFGTNFSDLMIKLGAEGGDIQCGGHDAKLPAGWPTW